MVTLSKIVWRPGGTKQHARAAGTKARPALECLEDRSVPSTLITETPAFSTPGLSAGAITLGPDLNLWFTEPTTGKGGTSGIGRLSPDGTLTTFPIPTPNSQPFGIAAGPDGNVWFTEENGDKVGRITPAGVVTEFAVPSSNFPTHIVAGSDGNLWFTTENLFVHKTATLEVGRVSPQGTVTLYAVPTSHLFSGLTAGPDGNLWFAGSALGALPLQTPSPEVGYFTTPTAANPAPAFTFFTQGLSGTPRQITTGPDGNLWFTEDSNGIVGSVTTAGAVSEHAVPTSSVDFGPIVAGQDGKLWFTESDGSSNTIRVARLATSGALEAEFVSPPTAPGPNAAAGLTVGPHGTLWFTEVNNNRVGTVRGVLDLNPNYVEKLYEDALGRLAGTADFAYWVPQVDAGNNAAVADGIERSAEARRHVVAGWYQAYLGRPADPAGLDYFSGLMLAGVREDRALADLLASDEYYNHAGAVVGAVPSDTTLVQALYQQLLGRPAGAADLAYWLGQLPAAGRAGLAYGILTSQEYRTILVNGYFSSLLHWQGPVDPSAVQYYVLQPWGPTTIRVQLELTPVYFLNG